MRQPMTNRRADACQFSSVTSVHSVHTLTLNDTSTTLHHWKWRRTIRRKSARAFECRKHLTVILCLNPNHLH